MLYDHQKITIDLMKRENRCAIWLEQGLGKTLCAIRAIEELGLKRAVVVCPNYLKQTWYNEFRKWSPSTFPRVIEAKGRDQAIEDATFPKIINYEGFRISYDRIRRLNPEVVVFDESQYIKERSAKISKTAWDLSKNLPKTRVWCMTGTPIYNTFADYYSQYKTLRPDLFRTWTDFKNRFLVMGGYMSYKVVGSQNEDIFYKLTDPYTIRLKKEDCIDLPDKIYQTIEVDMDPKLREAYNKMAKEAAIEIENAEIVTADMVVTRLMRLQQLCAGWIGSKDADGKVTTHEVGPNPKIETVLGLVEGASGPVILWAHFRKDIHALVELLKKEGHSAEYINGEVGANTRQQHITNFQAGKIKVLVIQDSIVAGMTLTAATAEIFYQNGYSYANRMQAEDRAHRIGQSKHITIYDVVVKNTIEGKIKQAIERKQNIAAVVDKNSLREIFLEGVRK